MNANDRSLILAAQNGNVDAFSILVERNWIRLVRFARSVAGEAEAEDVVQESLVASWTKLASLKDPEAFPAWLVRIVARRCFRQMRRRTRWLPLASVSDPPDPGSGRGIQSIDVERVLDLLPPRQRAVMHLTVMEGMSDREIGRCLGIAAASVRSHRRRARETLRSALAGCAGARRRTES